MNCRKSKWYVLFKRDDLNRIKESHYVIWFIYFCRDAVDLPRHLPEPLSTATPLNQNMTDRSIPDAVTEGSVQDGRFGQPWLKMIFFSAHSKGHGGRFRGDRRIGWPRRKRIKGHVIYRSKRRTIKVFWNLEFKNYQS